MKKNFDDIIRQRIESREYPVDPNHRDAMAQLLEGKKRRGGIILWWLGGAAVVLIAGFLFYQQNTIEPIVLTADVNHMTEVKSASDVSAPEPAADKVANEQSVKYNSESSLGANAASYNSKDKDRTSASVNSNAKTLNANHNNLNGTTPSVKAKSDSGLKVKSSGSANEILTVNDKTDKNQNGTSEIPIANFNQDKESTIKAYQNNVEQKKTEEKSDSFFKVELENPNEVRIVSEPATIQVYADSVQYDPWTGHIYDGIHRYPTVTDPIAMLDMEWEMDRNKPTAGAIKPALRNAHPLYLLGEAGFGLVLGSKPEYDGGTKWNLGGGLGLQLAPRVHLQLTGGYLMQDGGFQFERMSTVTQSDFGVRSEFNSLKPDRLHYAYGKLGFAYRVQKSVFNVHVGSQYLYGAQGTITVHEEVQVGVGGPPRESRGWLSTNGLRKLQWFSDVSYGYRLLPALYLQGGVTMYYSSLAKTDNSSDYYWTGKTAPLQPFITLNYLIHGK